ncbi:MAG: hypothetical protein WDN30_10585 [Pararobbsia sp.]
MSSTLVARQTLFCNDFLRGIEQALARLVAAFFSGQAFADHESMLAQARNFTFAIVLRYNSVLRCIGEFYGEMG